jgi:hypothetical protein
MADQELQYRVRRKGFGWYWEVLSNCELLQSGIEPTSLALLKCALYGTRFSREFYDVQPELYYPTRLHILACCLPAQDSYPLCLRRC